MTDALPPTASWGRRILALWVDWAASTAVVLLFLGPAGWSENPYAGFYTLWVFILESAVLTAFAGGSFGKIATRLRVLSEAGGRIGLVPALLRSVLVALVVPPLVFKPDGRGLHDLAARTRTVKLADLVGQQG